MNCYGDVGCVDGGEGRVVAIIVLRGMEPLFPGLGGMKVRAV